MNDRAQRTVEIHVDSGPHQGLRLTPPGPEIHIGRGARNDVVLAEDHTISERHARIYLHSDQWFAEDSGSRNGLYLQSAHQLTPIKSPLPLHAETILVLGSTRLRVVLTIADRVSAAIPDQDWAPAVLQIALAEGQLQYRFSGIGPVSRQYTIEYAASLPARISRDLARLAQRGNAGEPTDHAALEALGNLLSTQIVPQRVRERLAELQADALVLSHDSELINVPWELVLSGDQFWCERFVLGRQIVLGDLSQRVTLPDRPWPQRMLIVADPGGDLPEAREEAEALLWSLQSSHPGLDMDFLAGERATRISVLRALALADLVYYIGHGVYDPERPEASGWQLSDGPLGPERIRELSRLPRFIFSNACNSAEDTPQKKDTMGQALNTGMASGLVLGGVGAVIGARWPILAESSSALANVFFHRILRGHTLGAALREARVLTRRSHGVDDLSWAAFILYGNPVTRLAPIAPEAPCK